MNFKVVGHYIDFGKRMINIDCITDISFDRYIRLYFPRKYGNLDIHKESDGSRCDSYDILLSDEDYDKFEIYLRTELPLRRRSSFEF